MFTIIMLAYNKEAYVSEAIRSVLVQSLDDFELIIVDDGSSDNTGKILHDFAGKFSAKISLFSPGRIGKNAAFNLAVSHANGDWIYFFGADDILPKNALAIWSEAIKGKDKNEVIAIGAREKLISKDRKYDGLIIPNKSDSNNWSSGITLYSKGLLNEIYPIPENYPNEDTWIGLFISYFASVPIRINGVVNYYRIHEGNAIPKSSTFKIFNERYHSRQLARIEFLDKYKSKLSIIDQNKLQSEIVLENYRFNGEIFNILTNSRNNFIDKSRAVLLSNKLLYKIKNLLDRFLLGN